MSYNLNRVLTEGQAVGIGVYGDEFINDQAVHTPPTGYHFWAVVPKEDTVFNVLTDTLRTTGSNNPADGSEVHPSGVPITGHFTSIDLASGACWAYLAPN